MVHGMFARAALLLLPVCLVVGGCSSKKTPSASSGKILIVGLDGAEWDLIRPMVAAGELPHIAALMERGVQGNLRSLEPLAKSPAIWTTMATGKSPAEHGIKGFIREKDGKLLTENARRVKALWNIASSADRSVGLVGWLVSWPAEPVRGFVVSDYLQYDASPLQPLPRRTYPPELEREIASQVIPWSKIPWSFVQRFLDTPLDTATMSPQLEALLRPMRWIAAGDLTFARVGARLYRERRPDFFSVYFRGMDAMGHLYWNYHAPESVPEGSLNPELRRYVSGAMRAYYRFTDELLGTFLDLADERTTILVVSDHGFQGGAGRGIEMHKLDGVLLMAGYRVGKGTITGATVYDITPTTLALMGLPPAQDMPGKVLWPALDGSIPQDRFKSLIATYETGARGPGTPVESAVDEEVKERLRSLGYID